MKKNHSLIKSAVARRIFFLFIICALLPVSVLSVISLLQVSRAIKTERRDQLRYTSKNAGMTVLEMLYLFEKELRTNANAVSDSLSKRARSVWIPEMHGSDKRFLALSIVSADGKPRKLQGKAFSVPVVDARGRQHLANGKALLFRDSSGDDGRLFMAVLLTGKSGEKRLLVGQVNTEYLWAQVRLTLPPGVDLYVVDLEGRPLFNSSATVPRFISRVMSQAISSSIGNFIWQEEGHGSFVNFWSIYLPPLYQAGTWVAIASRSTDDALQPLHLFGRTFFLVIALALLIVVFLSSIQIRRNLVPLALLRKGAQQLSNGSFEARVSLDSGDEFEELANVFNGMAGNLQRQFTALEETSRLAKLLFSASDQQAIAHLALLAQDKIIPCRTMAITLVDPADVHVAITYRTTGAGQESGIPSAIKTILNDYYLCQLRENVKCLPVTDPGKFGQILLPDVEQNARYFYVFPFSSRESLAGALTIGYERIPSQVDEDLTRARKIADEIAAALDNVRLIEELNNLNVGTIRALANAVDAKSSWTAGHSERVTGLALDISRALGLSEADRELVYLGGLFHDIGKIAVPEAILEKKGRLTDEEYAVIKTHSEVGARILAPIKAYEKIIPIIAQHHEWFNGNGYPSGLAGEGISLGGRILAVADVFDALASDRPYRSGWEPNRVLEFIEEKAGTQFDPQVVEALMVVKDRLMTGILISNTGYCGNAAEVGGS